MNRWLALLVMLLGWLASGFALLAPQSDPKSTRIDQANYPARIVSMAPNLTEILFALGLDDKIVAVTRYSDYPPRAADKPKLGTFWQPNIEAIIAAKPDLVVTLGFQQQADVARRLNRIGYNCLMVNIETVEELFEAIHKIGTATGKQPEATNLAGDLRAKMKCLSSLVATGPRPTVLWVIDREPLRVAGRDTFVNELIELAGGVNAIGPTVHKYPPIGGEQVIASAPEVIIEPASSNGNIPDQYRSALDYWRRFSTVPAVANNRIYVIPPDTVSRLGPRVHQGLRSIAECIKPELFQGASR